MTYVRDASFRRSFHQLQLRRLLVESRARKRDDQGLLSAQGLHQGQRILVVHRRRHYSGGHDAGAPIARDGCHLVPAFLQQGFDYTSTDGAGGLFGVVRALPDYDDAGMATRD